jgi:tRNA modification GTPase
MILRDHEDTIVALATPAGEGAIAVIRLSGPDAVQISEKCFRGKTAIQSQQSHTVQFGKIIDFNNRTIDEVLCTLFKSPKSFTGEDVVEFGCHGGQFVVKKVLEVFISAGARPADPGEFTKRAFLNGKMDLSQAEAIADLIHAQSDRAHTASLAQLEGKLAQNIRQARDRLIDVLKLMELELDFIEDDLEFVDKSKVLALTEGVLTEINVLLESFRFGKIWREGISAAIIGAPNAGKSSILNALLGQERAIVTHIPGTTRDFIEESLIIDGILFRISDTAGIRETEDFVEKEGVKRTRQIIEKSDISIIVVDRSREMPEEERIFISDILTQNKFPVMLVENKIDLTAVENIKSIEIPKRTTKVRTSALQGIGIGELKSALSNFAESAKIASNETSAVVTSRRHQASLLHAKEGLESAIDSLKKKASNEFVAVDLRTALDALGEIIGEVTTEEILNDIFSKFCIGK